MNGKFLTLWSSQTISEVGSQVTLVAFPFCAVQVLGARATEMGVLNAVAVLPFPVLALWVGAWVDRLRRRRILIAADLLRAALLASIPVAAAFGALSMIQLYLVALAVGCATVWFDLAYTSYIPQVVSQRRLVGAHSALTVARSGAQVAGPGIGGAMVQLLTAPFAITLDAISFLASALLVGLVRNDPVVESPSAPRRLGSEIAEGMRFVLRSRVLAASALAMSVVNLFRFVQLAVFVLYLVDTLRLNPAIFGTVLLLGGFGAVAGGLLAALAARVLGIGPAVIVGTALFGASSMLVPLASGTDLTVAAMLVASQFLTTLGLAVLEINLLSLRQAITPEHLQGRVGATLRMTNWTMKPLGSVLGGVLGDLIGLRATIWIAVTGGAAGALWMLLSPIRRVRATSDIRPVLSDITTPNPEAVMKVLVINSHPYGELFVDGACRVPVPPEDRMLVTSEYNGGMDGYDRADFPLVATCQDIYDEEQVRQAVRSLAARARPDRIVTISEQLMLVAAELREELGIGGQDVESTRKFRDKVVMKRVLREAGCPGIPRYVNADDDLSELPWQADQYVVKHRLGYGSETVCFARDLDGINSARLRWQKFGPGVEVEEFIAGEMYHCDSIVHDGVPIFSSVSTYLGPLCDFETRVTGGSRVATDAALRERIKSYNAEVLRHLGLRAGVTHLEVFHTPDDRIVFCEIASRPGGGGVCGVVRQAYGVDMITAAIRAQSGFAPLPLARPDGDGQIWALLGFYARPDRVPVRITTEPMPDLGVLRYYVGASRPGPAKNCTDWVHKFIMSAADLDEFDRRCAEIADVVERRGWRAVQSGVSA